MLKRSKSYGKRKKIMKKGIPEKSHSENHPYLKECPLLKINYLRHLRDYNQVAATNY